MRVGQIGLLPFRQAGIHQQAQQQGPEFENVLPGTSSTSVSAHPWRKPKQLCVFCAVWWLSGEGGYLGWGSSYAWASKLVDGSSFLDITQGMDMKLHQQEVDSSSPHVLKPSNLEVPPVPGKMQLGCQVSGWFQQVDIVLHYGLSNELEHFQAIFLEFGAF